jgi:hypothetical protein
VNHVSVTGLHKFRSGGLLLILTALLAISTFPVGVVVGETGISPEQAPTTLMITVHDCSGNPIANVVIQVQGLGSGWGGWAYTNGAGVATLSVPQGTFTLDGGYSTFKFSQPLTLASGVTTVAVNLGSGCYAISINNSVQALPSAAPIKPIAPR